MKDAKAILTLFVTSDGNLAIQADLENPIEVLGMLELIKSNIISDIGISKHHVDEGPEVKELKSNSKYEA